MTFLSAWRLLLLVVPIALAITYVVMMRRRSQVAARFSSVDLLASIVPKRSGWQRFLPWAALLTALAVGVLAFAQPAMTVRTPKERATIMLTLDTSASMAADDVSPTRLQAAQESARGFVKSLPPTLQVGLVTFDSNAQLDLAPTTDRAALLQAIDSMQLGGGTATGSGINLSLQAIAGVKPGADGKKAPAAIVLMSDGAPTVGDGDLSPEESVADATTKAKAAHVPVTTIAFGTADGTVTVGGETQAVPSDPAAMKAIAEATGGKSFTAESSSQLSSVYDEIGSSVGYDESTTEVTAWFAGAAFLLAALAAGFALRWGQQLA